ncbi:MAG: phospho-N-acetylmuramoyl-pentapeptide-transferase [candidate division KSB1 bacterium]|nr:phospho-N-acetylmuramoyl-pentapeptide-transferase [candidate division KSB1 bacterium]MDZ7311019.1 phospho-N-acetylmuramoyl-pentapeptide-transferase [candidate division KSB1 bacterium]
MLYYLLYPLSKYISGFNIFQYISFRAAFAAITALLISFFVGPRIIHQLREKQIGQEVRKDGPQTHLKKQGTPTMGGLIILTAILLPTLLWARATVYVALVVLATVWMGLVGFIDDYLKVVKKYPKGLYGRYKIIGQVTLGLLLGTVIFFAPQFEGISTLTTVPFFKNFEFDFGFSLSYPFNYVSYVLIVIFVITATSNSVNLTDGLDGLAVGLVAISATAWAAISYISGRVDFSDYLNILYLPGAGELTVFCAALGGAALGFLWFNTHPAQVFMGDTGSLALGSALGSLAILLKKELLLIIIGGVFVAETMSVILQVWYFRRTGGKRIFRMAPLHHHFELKGWSEPQVVVRFWIIGILLALLSLSTFKIR